MEDDDELTAEIADLLQDLVEAEAIELVSTRGAAAIANPLLFALQRRPQLDIAEWLVERDDVAEVYADGDELRERFAGVLARIAGESAPVRFNPELARAIERDPGDAAAWSVYGDWLTEQGDPRGELVALQIALARCPDPQLAAKERTVFARHKRRFYGDLALERAEHELPELTWRNGFFHTASVVLADLEELLGHESARFLDKLVVRSYAVDEVLAILARRPPPATLRTVELVAGYVPSGSSQQHAVDVAALLARCPRLTRLLIRTPAIVLGAGGSQLRELALDCGSLRCTDPGALAAHHALERLDLGVERITGPDPLAALFAHPPPRLVALSFQQYGRGSAIVQALAKSPLAATLEELALVSCEVSNRAAMQLCSDAFARLARVDLRGCELSGATVAALEKRFAHVEVGYAADRYDDVDE